MAWTQASNPTAGSITQASDPTGEWTGNCNNLDVLSTTTPVQPPDFPGAASDYSDSNIHILEGFEFPAAYYDGTNIQLWLVNDFSQGGGVPSVSTTVRSSTLTAGHSLSCISTTTVSSGVEWFQKPIGSTYQYFRVYFSIESYTNGNGSERTYNFAGWTDSTGFRSTAVLIFPAGGGAPHIAVGQNQSGLPAVQGSVALSTGVWYRMELTTERLTAGMANKVNIFLGDTDTLVDSATMSTGTVSMNGFAFVGLLTSNTGNALSLLFDDLRVQTSTRSIAAAATNLPLYGPGGIWAMYPSSDIQSQFTPLSSTNYSNVDEFPVAVFDDDTSYVSASAAAPTDVYGVSFHPTATMPVRDMFIKAVMTMIRQKNPSGSAVTLKALYQDADDVTYLGRQYANTIGGYEMKSYSYLEYPTGLPVEFADRQGVGQAWVVGSPTNTVRVTSAWGLMDIASEAT